MIRKQSPATVSTICFRIHYDCNVTSYFTIPLVAHYPKLPGLQGSPEAEGFKKYKII